MKLFEKDFTQIKHIISLANGLQLKRDLEYSKRKQLNDQTSFSFINTNARSYSNNIPDGVVPKLVRNNNYLIFNTELEYTLDRAITLKRE